MTDAAGRQCVIVVPYRADESGIRQRNLDAVLRHIAQLSADVLVVEPDESGPSPDSPFAKAVACNIGFAATDHPVLAFIDADMLVSPSALAACIAGCADGSGSEQVDVARPYGRLVDLDERQSALVATTGELPDVPDAPASDARGDNEHIPLCGGAFVIRREAYELAGGMDEGFAGWGGEDDALSIALARLGMRRAILSRRPALHLWHRRATPSPGDPRYAANVERLTRWRTCDEAGFADLVRSGHRSLQARRIVM